ncbi:MAG: hypoxanthine phosphoribosyltransferase [Eubacteriales bacterium]|jgi:hypoxanthine phosphoribosyltransferase
MAKVIDDIERVLVDETEILTAVKRIASEIDAYYRDSTASGKKLLLLGILKGSVVFMGDLMKHITVPVEIDFMKVSSYGRSTKSSGSVNIMLDLFRSDLPQTDILIIEDIIDSGRTLSYLTEYLLLKGAHSVRTCTLLDKPQRREVDFKADHVGIIIPDEFVVGYGLDYAERYRTLPYIGILKPEIYNSSYKY